MTRRIVAFALVAAGLFGLCAGVPRPVRERRASGIIRIAAWPYLPASVVPVRVDGFSVPYHIALMGIGSVGSNGLYAVPADARPGTALLIAGNQFGLAARVVRIGEPPSAERPFLAVATYDDGVVFHDARNFAVIGVLATGGTPSDAAIDATGRLGATDTQGSAVTVASFAPWGVSHVDGVPLGEQIAVDDKHRAFFVTDRDVNGKGALTRVDADGSVARVVTGLTAEGVAIDPRRDLAYVANVNDGSVAIVDDRTMRLVRRFHAIARIFSIALSPDGSRLYGVSNQSTDSPFAAAGSAIEMALRPQPHLVSRSAALTFPVGGVLDAANGTFFVTDESRDRVYVLDARTLREKHVPLPTCRTPWKPAIAVTAKRLFVPCARADAVDVFDTVTLRRVKGAPFATGGYPLAVAMWPGRRTGGTSGR